MSKIDIESWTSTFFFQPEAKCIQRQRVGRFFSTIKSRAGNEWWNIADGINRYSGIFLFSSFPFRLFGKTNDKLWCAAKYIRRPSQFCCWNTWNDDNIWLLNIVLLIFSWIFFCFFSFFVRIAQTKRRRKKRCCMTVAIALAKVWIGFTGIVSWFAFSAHNGPFFSPPICARFTLIKIIIYGSYEQFYLCEAYMLHAATFAEASSLRPPTIYACVCMYILGIAMLVCNCQWEMFHCINADSRIIIFI